VASSRSALAPAGPPREPEVRPRVPEGRGVDDLGLEELIEQDGIVAIEWADRWPRRPASAVEVSIEDHGGDSRRITIRGVREP